MNQLTKKFIQYARVSTKTQDYGLKAQKIKMDQYVQSVGGNTIALFEEKESGRKNKRKELMKAIEWCKISGATLLVSKLDRLGRITKELLDHRDNLDLVIAENPEINSNTLLFGITAIIAQYEAEQISARIKDGMAVAKMQGRISGRGKGWKHPIQIRKKLSKIQIDKAKLKKEAIQEFADQYHNDIRGDYNILAALMKARGFTTRFGKPYSVTYLKRMKLRIGKVFRHKPGRKKKILLPTVEHILPNDFNQHILPDNFEQLMLPDNFEQLIPIPFLINNSPVSRRSNFSP